MGLNLQSGRAVLGACVQIHESCATELEAASIAGTLSGALPPTPH